MHLSFKSIRHLVNEEYNFKKYVNLKLKEIKAVFAFLHGYHVGQIISIRRDKLTDEGTFLCCICAHVTHMMLYHMVFDIMHTYPYTHTDKKIMLTDPPPCLSHQQQEEEPAW